MARETKKVSLPLSEDNKNNFFSKMKVRNPCFKVIAGLGIRGFDISGIFVERNSRE